MKPTFLIALLLIAASASCQTFASRNLPSASITFACDCDDDTKRVISQRGGETLSIDCSKGEKVVQAAIRPGTHLFSGMPLVADSEAIFYRIIHDNGRESETGFVYYSDRTETLHLEIEPGDRVVFELKKINNGP